MCTISSSYMSRMRLLCSDRENCILTFSVLIAFSPHNKMAMRKHVQRTHSKTRSKTKKNCMKISFYSVWGLLFRLRLLTVNETHCLCCTITPYHTCSHNFLTLTHSCKHRNETSVSEYKHSNPIKHAQQNDNNRQILFIPFDMASRFIFRRCAMLSNSSTSLSTWHIRPTLE